MPGIVTASDQRVADLFLKMRYAGAHIRVLPASILFSPEEMAEKLFGTVFVRYDSRRKLHYAICFGPAGRLRLWRRVFNGTIRPLKV